jgi:hypothetical protein
MDVGQRFEGVAARIPVDVPPATERRRSGQARGSEGTGFL